MRSANSELLAEKLLLWAGPLAPFIAAVAALILGTMMILLLGANPFTAFQALITGAFGSGNSISDTVVKATPLLFVGVGICISFRGAMINIGAEGQMVVGGLAAAAAALSLGSWSSWLAIPICLILGFLAGAVWGAIPGALRAYFRVNEILTTVMMNQIAIQLMNYFLGGPMMDPVQILKGSFIPQTARLPLSTDLPRLPPTRPSHWDTHRVAACHRGLGLPLENDRRISGFVLWVSTRMRPGRREINVKLNGVVAMVLSGAMAGLGGATQLLGVYHGMFTDGSSLAFTGNAGFNGIVVALFGQLHPLGTISAALLFGGLIVGANSMQRAVQIPTTMITALNGILVIFVVSSEYVQKRSSERRQIIKVRSLSNGKFDPCRGCLLVIERLLTLPVLMGVLTSGISLATPYLYAATGEVFGQVSGVLNLGVEGIMLMGAYSGFYVTFITGDPWLGLIAAIAVGASMGLLMAFVSVTLHAQQGVTGIGLYIFGGGMSALLFDKTLGTVQSVQGFSNFPLPLLSEIPVAGKILFNHNVLTYGAFLSVLVAWFVLQKTTWGLAIKTVGQNPSAADSLGINVARVRYITVTLGGAFSGVAGASLSIALLNVFQQNMTAGMGFIAVALVYFGGWRPAGVLVGSLLFSMVNALQNWIQVLGVDVPSEFAVMMPYVLTILILVFAVRKVDFPKALTKPFERGHA